jgi:hypothetical protein
MTDRPVMTVIFVYRVTSSRIVLYVRCFMIDICMWTPDAFILAFPFPPLCPEREPVFTSTSDCHF